MPVWLRARRIVIIFQWPPGPELGRRSLGTNSGPLSDRRCSGTPFITMTSASAEMTLAVDQRRSARTSRLSRVCSSIRFEKPYATTIMRPRADESLLHTWLRCVGLSRTHEPSLSHRRPRGFCFCGTFSPSRRQIPGSPASLLAGVEIRSTRSLPTRQPARLSSAVIRRYPYRPYWLASWMIACVSASSSSRRIAR